MNEEISYLTLENKSLQKHLAQQQQQHDVRTDELVSELNSTRKEMVSHTPHCFLLVTGRVSTLS